MIQLNQARRLLSMSFFSKDDHCATLCKICNGMAQCHISFVSLQNQLLVEQLPGMDKSFCVHRIDISQEFHPYRLPSRSTPPCGSSHCSRGPGHGERSLFSRHSCLHLSLPEVIQKKFPSAQTGVLGCLNTKF